MTQKTIYHILDQPNQAGQLFDALVLLDYENSTVSYPYTEVPIPDELKGKQIKFNWSTNSWTDITEETLSDKVTKLTAENEDLQAKVKNLEDSTALITTLITTETEVQA